MKILLISDTHSSHDWVPDLPEADVFIHAGDFMNSGKHIEEILSFNNWLNNVPVKPCKRFICAGNHDVMFDEYHIQSDSKTAEKARSKITNGVYVQDQEVVVNGVKFYFSPWTPEFFGWGFNVSRGAEIKEFWDKIPDDVNVLVTHGPPMGILDQIILAGNPGDSPLNHHLGCEELYKRVKNLKDLKYHVFGHIHGSRGRIKNVAGGPEFINASFLNERYRPHQGDGYFLVEV